MAAEMGLPGIWLTPLLHDAEIATGFEQLSAPALSWVERRTSRGTAARAARGHEVLELEGANHALQIEADPLASIDALRRVVERMDAFVAALGQ